ncbi:MAG: aconitate hydratase AcnA [Thermomicrobiales bacterium]
MDPAPLPVAPDPFGARASLATSFGETVTYFRLDALQEQGLTDLDRLPFTVRVLLENVLRHAGGEFVDRETVEQLAGWVPRPSGEGSGMEIPFMPGRVLMQDLTGVPAVVDLAAMRDAVARLGGDVTRINPLVPADLVIDHSVHVDRFGTTLAFNQNVDLEYSRNTERYELLRWAQQSFQNFRVVPPGTGIVHQVNLEYLAPVVATRQIGAETVAFPDTLVGTDSHTTMINGLGALGWGVGGIEAEAVLLGQPLYLLEPEVVGVRLVGSLPEGSTATDLVLAVTEMLRQLGVVGRFVEFCGAGLSALSLADRATIANMAPEYGATAALFPVDAVTLDYLRLTGRAESQVALVESYCKAQQLFRTDDTPEPQFNELVELDLDDVTPSVAGPRRPQDRLPLPAVRDALRKTYPAAFSENGANGGDGHHGDGVSVFVDGVTGKIDHGSVVIAAITSCTNTSNPSVMLGAGLLAKNAVERGLDVPGHVKTSLAPGSQVVNRYLTEAGLLPYLEALGFHIIGYGCTTCIGNSGPLPEPVSKAIDENNLVVSAVLSGNRNFEGRIHQQVRAAFLASPPLVVAYALAGTVDLDLAEDPIGRDPNGDPVYLRDIWPSQDDVRQAIETAVDPAMFREEYAVVFAGDERWQGLDVPTGSTYAWNPDSTYVQNPPFFAADGVDAVPGDIRGARVLALLGDSVTTDHISPAGNIARTSPAGRFLIEKGVPPHEFNSYGARRGNHEVMIRGTFANIRLRNQLVGGKEGNLTLHLPSGEEMSIYDAAMRYAEENTPLVVVAGKEYGTGSSRDWAAKGTLLLGVKAVLVDSFERIHRSNLVGMGVLPLQFLPGENATTHGLTGHETFDILGIAEVSPRKRLTVRATRSDGEVVSFEAIARIDTPVEVTYYRNGGILQTVLKRLTTPQA